MIIHWKDLTTTTVDGFDSAIKAVDERFPGAKAGDTKEFVPGIARTIFSVEDIDVAEVFWEIKSAAKNLT